MVKLIAFFLLATFAVIQAGLVPRIIDGKVAKPGEIPYQVALQSISNRLTFCGGSILNTYYVITAAHCVDGKLAKDIKVIAGTVDLRKQGSEHYAERIDIHEKYSESDSWVNDIALIKVKTPFLKSGVISFVPLPASGEIVRANDSAIVSGFGRLAYQGETTNLLHWVNIKIASQDYCRKVWSVSRHIYDTQLCAYDPTAVRGHCKGDSGGPLTVKGKLVGLVSWSKHCADKVYPSVYTRVSSFIPWIKKHAI